MFSATAVQDQYALSTFFDSPTEERSNILFRDMFCHTIKNFVGYSDTTQSEAPGDIAELSDEWRKIEVGVQIMKICDCCAGNVGSAVSKRFEYLRACLKEEEGQDMDIALDSLRAAKSFLERSGVLRIPDVSLTAEGDVYFRWKEGSDRMLAIHFLDDRNVRFALFLPNPRHARSVKRYSGHETVDTVLDSADSLGFVRRWICR